MFVTRHKKYRARGIVSRALMGISSVLAGVAGTGAAKAATMVTATENMAAPSGYSAAPDVSIHSAPPVSHHCAIFQTCADTKIGLGRGDFLVKFQAMGLITNNTSSSVNMLNANTHAALSGATVASLGGYGPNNAVTKAISNSDGTTNLGLLHGAQGHVTTSNAVMPGFTFQYFITDHIAVDAIASSMRITAKARGTALNRVGGAGQNIVNGAWPGSVTGNGNVNLGSTWVLPPTITATWHFRPHKRFNPYAGVGLMIAFFYNNGPTRNRASSAMRGLNLNGPGVIQRMKLQTSVGPSFDFGFDYQVVGNWFMNFDVKQALLRVPVYLNQNVGNPGKGGRNTASYLTGKIHARDSVNPTVLAAGIGYRF